MFESLEELKENIRNGQVILFVGAGLSASLGLPDWDELVEFLGSELGYDARIFEGYERKTVLAEYFEIHKGGLEGLARWMRTHWSEDMCREKISSSAIYHALTELNFPIIYTTNYDHCLETAFDAAEKPWKRIVEIQDLVNAEGKTQIVKFHGDMDRADSMVLTESSYFERFDLNSPLDVKLRADALNKSILFLGYSLADTNLRYLTYKLHKLWRESTAAANQLKSYILVSAYNPVQKDVLERRGIYTITGESLDKSQNVESFLRSLL